MDWEYSIHSRSDSWNRNYDLAKDYYKEHGNLLIPRSYIIDNIALGNWIHLQRNYYKKNKLTKEKIDLLESIGMVWNPPKGRKS